MTTQAHQDLATELGALVRGLRDLSSSLPPVDGRRLDAAGSAVLAHVGDAGPLRLSALADRLLLDVSTVSRQVPALERAGWLAREPDPGDRRASLLRLTERGQQVLAERRRGYAGLLASVLPSWTSEELAALAGTLRRLNDDLSSTRPAVAPVAPAHLEAS